MDSPGPVGSQVPEKNGSAKLNGCGERKSSAASGNVASGNVAALLEEEETAVCPPQQGYRRSLLRSVVLYPLAALPLGLGLLLAYWLPCQWLRLTCYPAPLDQASHVIVTDLDGKDRVERVLSFEVAGWGLSDSESSEEDSHFESVNESVTILPGTQVVRYFVHRHLRYLYDPEREKFVLLRCDYSCSSLHDMRGGLGTWEQQDRLLHYGPNAIDVPVKPYHVLLVEEVLHPFYIFQIVAVAFWMADDYYYYSATVFFISSLSLIISLVQTRRHLQQLHDMVATSCTVTVLRDGREIREVRSESLVPGDVLVVPPTGMMMPCDAALLTGSAIVNEAMLTGESVPVTKTPLPHDTAHDPAPLYEPNRYKRHTLFSGTQVIQTRFYANSAVLAVVVRTGFSTAKGGMVRSILFPKPLNMKFYADAMKFVLVLGMLALAGFVYTLAVELSKGYQVKSTILRAFDVITIVVPPALPAALTVGTVYALSRLRKQQIYCISPQRVNLCGEIQLVCFDKTGTLTTDSLDIYGVKPVYRQSFGPLVAQPSRLEHGPLLHGMATCHSLTSINGQLTGDPLDLKMFQATGWSLQEPPGEDPNRFDSVITTIVRPSALPTSPDDITQEGGLELGVLRQFTFSSDLQRMSVLVRALPTSDPKLLQVYVKGAPETIRRLCKPESVPADFFETLTSLTQQGLRVLAVGHRTIHMPWHKAERVQRDAVECDLTFAGLLVMQNKLKPVTTPTITTLLAADIRTVMVTGDNLLTAVSVARECGMVASRHLVVLLKVELNPLKLPLVSYHLLGEGQDTAQLITSATFSYGDRVDQPSSPLLGNQEEEEEVVVDRPFHLAVDGKNFAIIREHCPELFQRLLVRGTVFARMSPNQKAQLVTSLMDVGYAVAMCGDGANDCGALKSAHAGISLSDTEASIASPFTSKVPNISCVPKVIREGRAALVTSFSVFKFMALYSLTEFLSAAILYSYDSNLGDFQYLYVDLVLILAFAFVMGFTGPYPRLVKRRPPCTLAGVNVLLSLCVQVILLVLFQLAALFYLQSESWYVPLVPNINSENIVCSENTAIFVVSTFQYVGLAVALSTGAPYRRPLFTNYWFMLCLVVLLPANIYLTLAPADWWPWLWRRIQLRPPPSLLFRVGLVELGLLYCVLTYFLEGYILSSEWIRRILHTVQCRKAPESSYKHILAGIEPEWPPYEAEGITVHV